MSRLTVSCGSWKTLFLRFAMAGLVLLGTTFVVVSRDEKVAGAWCTGLSGGANPWAGPSANHTMRIDNASISSAHWVAASNGAGMWNGVSGLTYGAVMMNGVYGDFNLYATNFGAWGWPNVPGITFNYDSAWNVESWPDTSHAYSQIFLNNTWSWNTSGYLKQSSKNADVTTIVGHEAGHSAGLNHPGACHVMCCNEPTSVMNATYTKKWAINSDDIGGLHVFY